MTRSRVLVALGGLAISAIFLWLAIRDADRGRGSGGARRRATSGSSCSRRRVHVRLPAPGDALAEDRQRAAARLRRFYEMVLGGLACNNVLPVRIGELLRAGWLSREAPMPGGRALGSVALDRVCDVVTLVVLPRHRPPGGADARVAPADRDRGACSLVLPSPPRSSSPRCTRAREIATAASAGRVRRIVRDTIDLLGEPVGRRRAARVARAEHRRLDASAAFAVYLVARSVGVDLDAARGRVRRVRARARRRDPLVARLHRHLPVDRRRGARAPRRAGEPGARVLDPHARELVRPDDARRRRDHRLAGAADGRAAPSGR